MLFLVALGWLAMPASAWAFYNPTTGRWLNRDPIGERGGRNLYGFVQSDSISKSDLLGKCVTTSGGDWPKGGQRKGIKVLDSPVSVVFVEVADQDQCKTPAIDVVFQFETMEDDLDAGRLRDYAEFTCDGVVTPFTDFGIGEPDPDDITVMSRHWNVTCHKQGWQKCRSKTIAVLLGIRYQKTEAGPLEDHGGVNASISWECDCECTIKGCINVALSRTEPRKQPRSQ